MPRGVVALALAVLSLLLQPRPADASCVLLPLEEKARLADVVASGTVDAGVAIRSREVTFRVSRVLKGRIGALVHVRLGPAISGGAFPSAGATSIDYDGTPGEHVLYLHIADGVYETNDCSGSHPGSASADEFAFFGAGITPDPATLADEFAALGALPFVIAVALITIAAVAVVRLRRHA